MLTLSALLHCLPETPQKLTQICDDLVAGRGLADAKLWAEDALEQLEHIVNVPCPFAKALLEIASGCCTVKRTLAIELLGCPQNHLVLQKPAVYESSVASTPFSSQLLLATRAIFRQYSRFRTTTIQLVLESTWYCAHLLAADAGSASCEDAVRSKNADHKEESPTKQECSALLFEAITRILRGCNVDIINIHSHGTLAAKTSRTQPFLDQLDLALPYAEKTASLHPAVVLRVILGREFSRDAKEMVIGMFLKYETAHLWYTYFGGRAGILMPNLCFDKVLKWLNETTTFFCGPQAETLRYDKLRTFGLAIATACSNMTARGLLLSSELHGQLGPHVREKDVPQLLQLPLMSDIRQMFAFPPCIATASDEREAQSGPSPTEANLESIPACFEDEAKEGSVPADASAHSCQGLNRREINRTVGEEQSNPITRVISAHIGTALTQAIVSEATANFEGFAQTLRALTRGCDTLLGRLRKTHDTIVSQARHFIHEAVPFLRAQGGKDWRTCILLSGLLKVESKKVVHDRPILYPPPDADPKDFVESVNSVLQDNVLLITDDVPTGNNLENCNGRVGGNLAGLKPDKKFTPIPSRLGAEIFKIKCLGQTLSAAQKLCVFALVSQCERGFLQSFPKYLNVDPSKRKVREPSKLCAQVDWIDGQDEDKHRKDPVFAITGAEDTVTFSLLIFHPDGGGSSSSKKEYADELQRYEDATTRLARKKKVVAPVTTASPHDISEEEENRLLDTRDKLLDMLFGASLAPVVPHDVNGHLGVLFFNNLNSYRSKSPVEKDIEHPPEHTMSDASLRQLEWKRVKQDRFDRVVAGSAWTYDPTRDNANLATFPKLGLKSYIHVRRSGAPLKRLPSKRVICIDPGLGIFANLFDPWNGDEFDIGVDMQEYIQGRIWWLAQQHGIVIKMVDGDERIVTLRRVIEELREELACLRMLQNKRIDQQQAAAKDSTDDSMISATELADLRQKIAEKKEDIETAEQELFWMRDLIRQEAPVSAILQAMAKVQRDIDKKVRHIHRIAARFIASYDIVLHPSVEHMGKTGAHASQTFTEAALIQAAHAEHLKLLTMLLESQGRKLSLVSEAFSTRACCCCGNLQNLGRKRVIWCTKCKTTRHRDGNAACVIGQLAFLRALIWLLHLPHVA
ncbi:hypothetical protein HDU89_005564 [Geranomyces variabilis]|nr:hypothetical protein HDU89_005564 [Geranomyces variabilis]